MLGNDIAGDAVKPGDGSATIASVCRGIGDDGDKDVRGEVGGDMWVTDAARDKPLHGLDVAAVEGFEGRRIASDAGDVGG